MKLILCVFILFSNPLLIKKIVLEWEAAPVCLDETKDAEYVIVLGGIAVYAIDIERIEFRGHVDRLMQALAIYKTGKPKKIVLVGGSGSVLFQELKESSAIRDYLIKIGFDSNDILIESKSRNTHENALYVKEKFGLHGKKCVLVTSALHMKRAEACFRKQDISVICFPTNRVFGDLKKRFMWDELIPSYGAMAQWELFFKEFVGYMVYKIKSYC